MQVVLSLTHYVTRRKKRKLCPAVFGGENFELLQETVHHGDCGGVTNARCTLQAMIKQGSNYKWGLPETISNVLGNAPVDTVGRSKSIDLPEWE